MTEAEIRRVVVEVLVQIQTQSGRPVPEHLDDDTRPLLDLEGFDSLNAEEVWIILNERLQTDLPFNPLIAQRSRRRLTITEIVQIISRRIQVPV